MKNKRITIVILALFFNLSLVPAINGNILELNMENNVQESWDVEYVRSHDIQSNNDESVKCRNYADLSDDKP